MIQGIISSACGTLLLSLSGYLSVHGWQYPFLVYGIAFVFAIAAWVFIFEPQNKMSIAQRESHGKVPLSLIAKLCISTLIASTIYFVYTLQFSLALSAIGIKDRTELGNISAVASIAVPVGALLFKLVSKWPIRLQLLIISIFIGVGLTGIGFSHDKITITVFAFTQQLGCGMLIPVLIAWGLNILPPEFRGRGMGFWSSAFFLGQFISPLVVTGVKTMAGSLLNVFVFFGILCIVLGLINYLFSRNTSPAMLASEIAH